MIPINQFRGAPALSRTVSIHIQARKTFMKRPNQHKSLPHIANQNNNGDKHDRDKCSGVRRGSRHKEEERIRSTDKGLKKKVVYESDEKWNPLRPYLNKEHMRRQEMIQYLNYKDFGPVTHASQMKELHSHYKDNSFYHIYALLTYQSNQITSSYKRPQTRIGFVTKPAQKVVVNHNPLRVPTPPMSPSLQTEEVNSRSSSSASQSE